MSDRSPAVVADDTAELRHVALAVRSRRRMLEQLRAADRAMDAGELAAAVGLHPTTTRVHLQVLHRAGLVERVPGRPGGPGRPRQLYAPADRAVTEEGHRRLAELLAGALDDDGDEGRRRAEEAGRRWAREEFPERREVPWEQAVGDVGRLFARMGFGPRAMTAGPGHRRLALETCPFRDVARAHPDVVCAVHLGLMRGALARLGTGTAAARASLRPFVTPDLCVAELPEPLAPRTGPLPAGGG